MRLRKPTNKEYVLIGLFTMIAAFPLATASDGAALGDLPYESLMRADWLTGATQEQADTMHGSAMPTDTMTLTPREQAVIKAMANEAGCPEGTHMVLSPMCRSTAGRTMNPMGELMR